MDELSTDRELLEQLGVSTEVKPEAARTQREERVIAGFEEIQLFYEEHGRAPRHGGDLDIFERLYAVRLDRMRKLEECRGLLTPLDRQGLLSGGEDVAPGAAEELDDAAILAEFGATTPSSIADLQHVRSNADRKAAEEIANRQRCKDFATFKAKFEQVQKDLVTGHCETRKLESKHEIKPGSYFILGGQKAYVTEKGKRIKKEHGKIDARLRVIFDNGTESNLLMTSLQRALLKDTAGRRIVYRSSLPLFEGTNEDGDVASGKIYVLRSQSDDPAIAERREYVHKIGVTSGNLKQRLANVKDDATFLLADVEIVATYELFNINPTKLENLLHRIFAPGRLDIEMKDRFGKPFKPREWFLVPLAELDKAVEKIRDGSITEYVYDRETASLKRQESGDSPARDIGTS